MKTRTKIILGVSLALVLCGAAAIIIIGGAAVYFSREINLPERVEKMKKAKTDGHRICQNYRPKRLYGKRFFAQTCGGQF